MYSDLAREFRPTGRPGRSVRCIRPSHSLSSIALVLRNFLGGSSRCVSSVCRFIRLAAIERCREKIGGRFGHIDGSSSARLARRKEKKTILSFHPPVDSRRLLATVEARLLVLPLGRKSANWIIRGRKLARGKESGMEVYFRYARGRSRDSSRPEYPPRQVGLSHSCFVAN